MSNRNLFNQLRYTKWALQVIKGKRTLAEIRQRFPSQKAYEKWVREYYNPLLTAQTDLFNAAKGGQYFLFFSARAINTILGTLARQATNKSITTYAFTIEEANKFTPLERTCYTLASKRFQALGMEATLTANEFHVEALAKVWEQNAKTLLKVPQATIILGILAQFYASNTINSLLEDF